MVVASYTVRWSHRLNGEDPASPEGMNNGSWDTTVAGSVQGAYWRVSGVGYNQINADAGTTLTAVVSLKYDTTPIDGTLLVSLENNSNEVKVFSTGSVGSLRIGGTGTSPITVSGLDLSKPFFFRLTLDGAIGRLYPFDMKEDETGTSLYSEVTSTGTSNPKTSFGCDNGVVDFGTFYYTNDGAFDSDEFSPSIWTSNMLQQTGLMIVEALKTSKRLHLKSSIENSSIIYAHDISPQVTARYSAPTIFVTVNSVNAKVESLGGGTVYHDYSVSIFVLTRAADYRYAHRLNAELSGEVVEEIYSNTGQNDNQDNITRFSSEIDMRQEEEEVMCVNSHSFTFTRRVNYRER